MKHNPNCELCRHQNPFKIPPDLYDALKKGKLVIFAGAGISTESTNVFPNSLYDELCDDLGIDTKDKNLAFPELVSLFEKQDNGRRKLLSKIRSRVQYVKSFKKLFNVATFFHHELADIHQINEIITTNWDDFFEQVCDAIPFVIPEDLAFWELSERKVLKIHGSINNLSTIIASRSDYDRCQENLAQGTIGGFLRVLLATKTIVYCGYSFNDPDFQLIHKILIREMKEFMPHAYIVTIDKNVSGKFDTSKVTQIVTDATYFLHCLKKRLMSEKIISDSDIYNYVDVYLDILWQIHHKGLCNYDLKVHPTIIYTYFYQDGISDALEYVLAKRGTGMYLCPTFVIDQIREYHKFQKEKKVKGKYWDVAYIEGYIQGLLYFIAPKSLHQSPIPFFYIMGCDRTIFSKKDFDRLLKSEKSYSPKAYKTAVKLYREEFEGKDIVPHHTPFLY